MKSLSKEECNAIGLKKKQPFEDLTGKKFDGWTVIKPIRSSRNTLVWQCKCKCGKISNVSKYDLTHSNSLSCNSCSSYRTTHSMSRTPTYSTWNCMLERCRNPHNIGYNNYGGRGIKVCDRWLKFENFYEDMGKKPKGLSLDRIDNDKNYCRENCKWSTRKEQNINRRTTKLDMNKAEQIRLEYSMGNITHKELGLKYNVSDRHIGSIVNNKYWIQL